MSLERQIRCRTLHSDDAEADCSVQCGTVAFVMPITGHRLLIHVAIAIAAAAAADGWITSR